MGKEWERLKDETALQYKAFECYLLLDARERTIPHAWRRYCDQVPDHASGENPSAKFRYWASENLWSERAAAYDDHISTKRRAAYEKGIEREAKKQGIDVEKIRKDMEGNFEKIQERVISLLVKAQDGDITLAGVSNLMRIQLNIAQYLTDETGNKGSGEQIDQLSEEQLAQILFEKSKVSGETDGDTGVS